MRILWFLLLFIVDLCAQNYQVTFRVTSAALTKGESIYIAGNQAQLGGWDAAGAALQAVGSDTYELSFSFPAHTRLEFKFTRGTWNTEAIYQKGKVPDNSSLVVEKDTIWQCVIPTWKDIDKPAGFNGKITGTTILHRNMKGAGIRPRDVIVWLPPGYDTLVNERYPVLYMHDGQNVFDPATSAFGIDWQADETTDSLIRADVIEPIIIVGIYNSAARTFDYSPCDTGGAYMQFIVSVLKPFIDQNYRTEPDREHTATAGSSMGGLISMMLVIEHSETFSKAACFSPAFKLRQFAYTSFAESHLPKLPLKLYIDNGGIGLEAELQPGVDEMISILRHNGFSDGADLLYIVDPNAEHNEPAWAARFKYPIKFFYGK